MLPSLVTSAIGVAIGVSIGVVIGSTGEMGVCAVDVVVDDDDGDGSDKAADDNDDDGGAVLAASPRFLLLDFRRFSLLDLARQLSCASSCFDVLDSIISVLPTRIDVVRRAAASAFGSVSNGRAVLRKEWRDDLEPLILLFLGLGDTFDTAITWLRDANLISLSTLFVRTNQ